MVTTHPVAQKATSFGTLLAGLIATIESQLQRIQEENTELFAPEVMNQHLYQTAVELIGTAVGLVNTTTSQEDILSLEGDFDSALCTSVPSVELLKNFMESLLKGTLTERTYSLAELVALTRGLKVVLPKMSVETLRVVIEPYTYRNHLYTAENICVAGTHELDGTHVRENPDQCIVRFNPRVGDQILNVREVKVPTFHRAAHFALMVQPCSEIEKSRFGLRLIRLDGHIVSNSTIFW